MAQGAGERRAGCGVRGGAPLEGFMVLGPCLGNVLDDAVVEVSLSLHFHPRVRGGVLHDQAVARRGRVGRCLLGPR